MNDIHIDMKVSSLVDNTIRVVYIVDQVLHICLWKYLIK